MPQRDINIFHLVVLVPPPAATMGEMAPSKAGFWETAIPDPTQAASQPRRLASFVLGCFLFTFLFLAVDSSAYTSSSVRLSFGEKYEWLGSWVFNRGQQPLSQTSLGAAAYDTQGNRASSSSDRFPDFAHYVWHHKLESWSLDSGRRLIIVGDVHGSHEYLG